jgi:hypothetical protein
MPSQESPAGAIPRFTILRRTLIFPFLRQFQDMPPAGRALLQLRRWGLDDIVPDLRGRRIASVSTLCL